MPHIKATWRFKRKRISKILCAIGIHLWLYSNVTQKPLKCVECHRKTAHYDERASL